jgi:hypothetical protein
VSIFSRGMSRRVQNNVDQSVIDTCHMCHVAVRSTPVGPSTGVVGTHLPAHQPPPTRVFLGSSPGVRKFHGCFGMFPGRSGKFRVFLGSPECVWEVPGVLGKFPGRFGNSLRRHGCFALPKAKLSILGRCFMLNRREFEVPPLDYESEIESFEI